MVVPIHAGESSRLSPVAPLTHPAKVEGALPPRRRCRQQGPDLTFRNPQLPDPHREKELPILTRFSSCLSLADPTAAPAAAADPANLARSLFFSSLSTLPLSPSLARSTSRTASNRQSFNRSEALGGTERILVLPFFSFRTGPHAVRRVPLYTLQFLSLSFPPFSVSAEWYVILPLSFALIPD